MLHDYELLLTTEVYCELYMGASTSTNFEGYLKVKAAEYTETSFCLLASSVRRKELNHPSYGTSIH